MPYDPDGDPVRERVPGEALLDAVESAIRERESAEDQAQDDPVEVP